MAQNSFNEEFISNYVGENLNTEPATAARRTYLPAVLREAAYREWRASIETLEALKQKKEELKAESNVNLRNEYSQKIVDAASSQETKRKNLLMGAIIGGIVGLLFRVFFYARLDIRGIISNVLVYGIVGLLISWGLYASRSKKNTEYWYGELEKAEKNYTGQNPIIKEYLDRYKSLNAQYSEEPDRVVETQVANRVQIEEIERQISETENNAEERKNLLFQFTPFIIYSGINGGNKEDYEENKNAYTDIIHRMIILQEAQNVEEAIVSMMNELLEKTGIDLNPEKEKLDELMIRRFGNSNS